jgi:hypothetical protein
MAESREEKKGLWQKLRRWPGLVLAALTTATVGFLVNEFGPAVVDLLRGDPALRFVVRENIDPYEDAGPAVAFAEPLPEGRFPSPSTCADAIGWLKSQGGVDAARTYLSISIEGMNDVPVLIQSMRARIEARPPPIRHTTADARPRGSSSSHGSGSTSMSRPRLPVSSGMTGLLVVRSSKPGTSPSPKEKSCPCRSRRLPSAAIADGASRSTPSSRESPKHSCWTRTVGLSERPVWSWCPSERVSFFDGQWARCRGDQECDASGGPTPTPLPERRIREVERLGTLPVPP